MNKFVAALITWCLFSLPAYAGSAAISGAGKEMAEVAPPPVPGCFDWTGFYLGAFGGYKRSNVDLDLQLSGLWNSVPQDRDLVQSLGSGDLDNDGAEAGGLIGYNQQFGCWLFGLEAAGGYLWARDSRATGLISNTTEINPFRVRESFKTHYLVTVAPRLGYAFGRFLPYITGGLAIADLEYAQQISLLRGQDTVTDGGSGNVEGGRRTETNVGWMVGGGLQYAISDHWSARGQYQYIDLGSVTFSSNFGIIDAPARHSAELTEHNASFALIYKF